MNRGSQPLVSVIVPLYNCAEFLSECLESLLAQTYQNWNCVIANNCSNDGSQEIAHKYANADSRIRVHENHQFLKAVPNFNVGLRQISPDCKYCKILFSDDWLFPECLERMVGVAEESPSVGVVGAYGLQGRQVMWAGLPYPSRLIPGRDVVRKLFLEDLYVFGTGTSVLFRADLVRGRDPFFNESNLHADSEACVALLKDSDFGFVNQVLTATRVRPGSLFAFSTQVNTLIAGRLHDLVTFGRDFLTEQEFNECLDRKLSEYYEFLARNLIRNRDEKFWNYHKLKLAEARVGFNRARLIKAFLAKVGTAALNPGTVLERLFKPKPAPRDPNFLPGFRES